MNVLLNSDQAAALAAVQRGENIFLTGPAGSGKSTLVRAIVEWAGQVGKLCHVTALTACAALLLGCRAKTLHSWAGIGLGRASVDALVADITKSPYAKKRWMRTDMLIIDEVSMMTPELFEKLDAVARRVRRSGRPWGAIQIILCGDFFQLPPVTKGGEVLGAATAKFAFDSPAWVTSQLRPVLLERIERQTDAVFQKLLNEARVGALSAESIAIIKSRQGLDWKSNMIRPTLLFSRNADVDSINEANLAALKKPLRIFEAVTDTTRPEDDPAAEVPTGDLLERLVKRLDNDAPYTARLELCEGCQVMLVTNMDQDAGLVNGSRGVIVGFRTADGVPVVQFQRGDPIAIEPHEWQSHDTPALKRRQIPLRVAYAVTIHKSQGATLDCALIDIGSSTFECGQAYVALSRVRNLESLYIWNFNVARVRADPRVVAFYEGLRPRDVEGPKEIAEEPKELPHTPTSTPVTSPPPEEETQLQPVIPTSSSPLPPMMHESWRSVWESWADRDAVMARVGSARQTKTIFPAEDRMFAAFQTPLSAVRVVLLAQDPYHGAGQAMGLAFSVPEGVKVPPSLRNIQKEYEADVGKPWLSAHTSGRVGGDLTCWAKQGVLLLNTVLTVEEGKANSHAGIGWDGFVSAALRATIAANPRLVFLAWGKPAQAVVKRLPLGPDHHVLKAAHPSPLSASHGFFGSRPFTKTNALLEEAIEW